MGSTVTSIVFYSLAVFIVIFSFLSVTSKRILRAATYLLFVLIGTAGLYLMLNYHFLAAVQISVYAGGIVVLYIFAILLTSERGEKIEQNTKRKVLAGIAAAVAGILITGFALLKNNFVYSGNTTLAGDQEINMKLIGQALMGTEKYQYLLPFEIVSVLLLACIIGGIMIARKR